MSIEVLTNGCGVNREYVRFSHGVWKENPSIVSEISIPIYFYPDVITMIYFLVQTQQIESGPYIQPIMFRSCNIEGYKLNTSYNTQGYLSASDYTDTSGISAGQATVRFDEYGGHLNATISNIKYANGSVIYMPSQSVYAANYVLYVYGYNNV